MKAEELWIQFCCEKNVDVTTPYEAWAFGGAPDELAELVLKGIKTATASAYDLYFAEGETEPLPAAGAYSVVLDSRDEALCVIRTKTVSIVPYSEVSAEHAYMEGEGDRSLAYWRKVHEEFFAEEFSTCGMKFTDECRIVCEEFEVLYKPV